MLGLPPLCSSSRPACPGTVELGKHHGAARCTTGETHQQQNKRHSPEFCIAGEKYGFAVHKGKAMSMKTNPSMKSRPALPALLRTPRSHHLPVFGVLLGVFPLPGVVGGGHAATRSEMLSRVLQKEGSVPCRNIFELMFVPSPGSGQNVKACSELEIF